MMVKRLDEREKLRFIADSGIKRAIAEMRKIEEKTYDALNDLWSSNICVFKDIKAGDGISNVCYNYIDEETKTMETRFGLIDEERKININKSSREVMERLFRVVANMEEGDAQELAASIIDWRDGDGNLSIPLGSAEDSYYRNLRYSYEAKDADFETLEEVLLVKGMTNDLYEKINEYITIYGDGKVNINTTSKSVLLSLGLKEDMVNKIMALLYGKNGLRGDADDVIFEDPGSIVSTISQTYNLSASEIAQLSAIVDQSLATKSNFFMIKNTARLNNGKNSTEATSIIDRTGKVLYWREG